MSRGVHVLKIIRFHSFKSFLLLGIALQGSILETSRITIYINYINFKKVE